MSRQVTHEGGRTGERDPCGRISWGGIASPKEYQPKTERGKRTKAKWDALKEPVKIAKRMADVTNCEKRLRAIAVKEEGKKSIDV